MINKFFKKEYKRQKHTFYIVFFFQKTTKFQTYEQVFLIHSPST